MKAISVQQPFAFEILSGQKTIEVRDQDTLYRGDLLVCSSRKPAFPQEDMEEMEEEYGCTFLYGQALCVVRLADVRPMEMGDEQKALVDKFDPEALCWVFEDVRPVIPFPVKAQKDIFEIEDSLVQTSPFKYGEGVVVKGGTVALDFGIDFSGWRGRVSEVLLTDEGEPRVHVLWDSQSLRSIPISVIQTCEKERFDWTGVLLRFSEIQPSEPRDTWDDVQEALDSIIEENPELFDEQ
ncbi:MAG: ASCH domain-containing protein [Desulfobacteraceae bacterium]|nr:ASCH domain-containing protein [Desulfobacteraceae bacterium]